MKNETKTRMILLVVAVCIAALSFLAGRDKGRQEIIEQQKLLQQLNRSSIENLNVEDGPIFVIGHRSPDSDTVCSAIAYARLLNMLGYQAEAVITESLNKETTYILKEAGIDIPGVLEDATGKNIFMVDHSEYAQAIEGMGEAHIVGILDHHGVGSVITGNQIVYEARPIGSTATIIWLDYINYGLEIDKTTAYLMLCAVLSDTDNLYGSTTTETDRQAVTALAEISGIEDVQALYRSIHLEKLSYEGMSSMEIFFNDYKEYDVYGIRFGIGLVDAIDDEAADVLAARMKEVLPEAFNKVNVDMLYASVGIRENGEKIDRIVPADDFSRDILEGAFPNYDEYDGTSFIFRTGLGRKTKFVPGLTDYLIEHIYEE